MSKDIYAESYSTSHPFLRPFQAHRFIHSQFVPGCWINLGSKVSAEIIGRAGFDWVLIDLEHGAGNDLMMYHQLKVLASTSATLLVRIDELNRLEIQRILDAGASGIMFP